MAHTAGPWKAKGPYIIGGNTEVHHLYIQQAPEGRTIADVGLWLDMVKEQEANARLMAEAPSLLAALKALRPLFECGAAEEYAAEIEAAEAAIERAEGS